MKPTDLTAYVERISEGRAQPRKDQIPPSKQGHPPSEIH